MSKEKSKDILKELYNISGFRVSLHSPDHSEVAAYPVEKKKLCRLVQSKKEGVERCVACDKEAYRQALERKDTYIYRCPFGLCEAVSPLYNFGALTGFLIMGQVREDGSEERLYRMLRERGASENETEEILEEIPSLSKEKIISFTKVLSLCAQHMTISETLFDEKPTPAQIARKYITDNYGEKILIKDICDRIGCSKSTLISSFKKEYGTTVTKYITDVRLNEARHMLSSGKMTVGEVADEVGFYDQSYFSKVFSAKFGFPPSEMLAKGKNKNGEKQ